MLIHTVQYHKSHQQFGKVPPKLLGTWKLNDMNQEVYVVLSLDESAYTNHSWLLSSLEIVTQVSTLSNT